MKKHKPFVLFLMLTTIFVSVSFTNQIFAENLRYLAWNNQIQKLNIADEPEAVRLIVVRGFESFIKELNDNGKSGYRLEKSLNYGGEGATQNFAAVLRLDSGNVYEYEWFSSPNKDFLESRLNYQASKGFTFANAFALTACSDDDLADSRNPSSGVPMIFRLSKGDAFLLERRNAAANQDREYKVFTAKVGGRGKPKQTIQDALNAVPQGFRPVKILFDKQGLIDFRISILLEKDLYTDNTAKIEYRFVKEVSGFEKSVNELAASGFRFIAGRRIGLIKFLVMAKEADAAAVYTFTDTEKYSNEFDKTVAQGNNFVGVMAGDLSCDSTKIENEKLVFARNSADEKRDFKVYNLFKSGNLTSPSGSLSALQNQAGQNYQVKELFYADGLNIVFGK